MLRELLNTAAIWINNIHHHSVHHSSSTIRVVVVHVSSNTLKAPLVYSLDSGELGYRAGERGGKKRPEYSPPPLQKKRGNVLLRQGRQIRRRQWKKKRSNFPSPEKRKRVRKTKEEVKKKMVENQNKNIIGGERIWERKRRRFLYRNRKEQPLSHNTAKRRLYSHPRTLVYDPLAGWQLVAVNICNRLGRYEIQIFKRSLLSFLPDYRNNLIGVAAIYPPWHINPSRYLSLLLIPFTPKNPI